MSDIFISYKQERRLHAERLAVILQAQGYEVWWDYRLVPGEKFRKTIEAQIDSAKAVIVLWCSQAIESNFVIDEAEHARKCNKLLQATLEAVEPPMGFRSADHRLSLLEWPGNADHEQIGLLLESITTLTGRAPTQPRDLIRVLSASLGSLPSIKSVELAALEEDELSDQESAPSPSNTEQEKEREHTYFKVCETADEYEAYLKRYPKGMFAELASSKINSIDRKWIEGLGISGADWGLLSRDKLLAKLGARASRAELEPRARRGAVEALTLLAMVSNAAGDSEEAARLYQIASNRAFPRAQCALGTMLLSGDGLAKNEQAGLELLRAASDRGLPMAQSILAAELSTGKAAPQDDKEAARLFGLAAEQGHAFAQYYYGRAHEEGKGLPEDKNAAVAWFRRAAEQDFTMAQSAMGRMLEYGRGVTKNEAEALVWYRKAAASGGKPAMNSLGRLLEAGKGTSKDEVEAVAWYRKSAEGGHKFGQYNLGRMLEKGVGTPVDRSEAIEWYEKAAAQGHPPAKAALKRLAN